MEEPVRTSARRHFELFGSLRAVAALAVLVLHALLATGIVTGDGRFGHLVARLNVGVAIFFVISGFLLYRPFVAARMQGRPLPDVRIYGGRRILRIYPAYWLALTVLAIWPGLTGVFSGDFWAYYGLVQVYGFSDATGLFPAWSLAVELTFYLLLPVYAWAMARLVRHPRDVRPEVVALGALLVVALVMRAALVHFDHRNPELWLSLFGRMDWFVPGMALAVASVHLAGREDEHWFSRLVARRGTLVWVAAAGAYLLLAWEVGAVPFTSPAGAIVETLFYGLVGFLVVLPAVFGEHAGGLVRRLLANRALLWLGLISYGIYLWHWPFALWVGDDVTRNGVVSVLAVAAMTIPCAALSWYLLERPVIAKGRELLERRRRAAPPAIPAEQAA